MLFLVIILTKYGDRSVLYSFSCSPFRYVTLYLECDVLFLILFMITRSFPKSFPVLQRDFGAILGLHFVLVTRVTSNPSCSVGRQGDSPLLSLNPSAPLTGRGARRRPSTWQYTGNGKGRGRRQAGVHSLLPAGQDTDIASRY